MYRTSEEIKTLYSIWARMKKLPFLDKELLLFQEVVNEIKDLDEELL